MAGRLANRHSKPKLLGITIPDELNPQRLGTSKLTGHVDIKQLAKHVDLKDVLRQVGNLAERVEARSEDVRMLSAQAKRLSRRVS